MVDDGREASPPFPPGSFPRKEGDPCALMRYGACLDHACAAQPFVVWTVGGVCCCGFAARAVGGCMSCFGIGQVVTFEHPACDGVANMDAQMDV